MKQLLSVIIFILVTVMIYGQDTSNETQNASGQDSSETEFLQPEEAPTAIFQTEIWDADVDFFLSGYWNSSLIGGMGLLFTPDGSVISSPFPGLEQGFIFMQSVDLAFSVWLMERYFIEVAVTSIQEEKFFEGVFKDIYFRMGYEGKEDEFLKHVYIGNRDISITPYRFLDVPEQGDASLGVEALMGSGEASHHILLRSDNMDKGSVTYIGSNLVTEEVIPLDDYIQGKFFKLPDSDVEDLEVYIEDSSGSFSGNDGRKYRKADIDDAVLDSEEGLVTLKEIPQGSVLVYYRKGVDEVGDPGLGTNALVAEIILDPLKIDIANKIDFVWTLNSYLGQDMIDRQIVINSKKCLRVWKHGEYSPFEILSSYGFEQTPPADLSQIRVHVISKGNKSKTIPTQVKFKLTPMADWFTAYLTSDLRGDLKNLYPFLAGEVSSLFDPDNLLYGPARDPRDGYLKYELLVSFLTPVTEYRLGENIVKGSVKVYRNGIEETRFEVDYDQGVITFLTTIGPDDRLEIYYRKKESLLNNSDLLFAWGNTIPLNETLTLELAGGLRWNALPGNYTEEAYSRTGTVLGSASLKGETEHIKFDVFTGVAYTNPDTTGIMRMLSMEGQGIEVSLTEDTAYPASLPTNPAPLNSNNRGKLFYKNFRDSSLMPYDWTGYEAFPYETGSKIGPYMAGGSSEGKNKGECLVLDFELDNNEWVGTQIPIYPDQGLIDFSSLESISLSYRAIDVQGNFKIYIQIGEIGEDLDGDGELDEEYSSASDGFHFNDTDNAATLLIGGGPEGTGNGKRDTEDIDGNDFLDLEPDDYIVTSLPSTDITAETNWQLLSETIDSTTEQLDLTRVRSIRILVVDNGSGSTGRLLIDRISLAGTIFWVDDSLFSGTVTAREIEEREAIPPRPEELVDAFPEVKDIFHPFGEVQEVLEIDWSDAGPGNWTLEGFTKSGTEGIDYRKIVLYLRSHPIDTGTDPLHFAFLDSDGKGIRWDIDTTDIENAWSEYEVSLDDKNVYRNDTEINSSVSIDPNYSSLYLFTVEATDTTSGTLYLDELHLTEPMGAVGAAFGLDLELNLPGELVTIGDHPLISNLTLMESAFFSTAGFSTLYGRPSNSRQINSLTELAFSLSITDLKMDLSVAATGSLLTLSGGHQLTLPNVPFPLVFSDTFSLCEKYTGRNIYRENTLDITWQQVVSLMLRSEASSQDDLIIQYWSVGLLFPAFLPLDYESEVSLQRSEEGFSPSGSGYFDTWIGGYSLLLPWEEGEEVERKGDLSLSLSLETRPFGATASGDLGFQSFDLFGSSRSQRNKLELELTFPLLFGEEDITVFSIIPGYRRRLQILLDESSLGDYAADLDKYFYRIGNQEYMFNRFPIEELFAPDAEAVFREITQSLDESFYTPEVFIGLSRSFGSRIRDLFVPSYFEFSVDKEFKKEGDLFDFFNNYRLSTQCTAINLFGAFGAYPLFPFYRIDEFITALTVTVSADMSDIRNCNILLENMIYLEGEKGNSFGLENRLNLLYGENEQWSDRVGILYQWYRYPEQGISLPLLSKKIGKSGFWAHIESLEVEFTGKGEDLSYHPLNLMLCHETSIVLPDHGYIKGEISVGLDREKALNNEKYLRLGIRALIEAQIEF